jgi:hypothetical protein
MPFHNRHLIATALLAGLMAMPVAAMAQSTEPTTPPIEEQAEATVPNEQQLVSFAAATILIVRIQQEAQERMQSAVAEAGLTLEQYNEIAQAAQADPELDQTLQTMIRERLGG